MDCPDAAFVENNIAMDASTKSVLDAISRSETPGNASSEVQKTGRAEKLAVACLSFASLVIVLDATILVTILPILAEALNGSAIETFWAGTSFLLSSATFQPFLGALSDVFGRRELFLASIFLFAAGSLIAALANGFPQLLAGRTIQGIGGGGIMALVLIICTDIIPLRERPKFNSYVQMSWALGTVTGPLIGAALAERATWRWVFYINLPICGVGGAMAFFAIRFRKRQKTFAKKVSEIDWIGGCLLICSAVAILLGITWGGIQYPWDSYQTLLSLLLGACGLVLTVVWEAKYASNPFIRMTLFSSWSGISAYVCAVFQDFIMYSELYYVSLYLLSVSSLSAIMAGAFMVPITAGLVPSSIAVGIAISKRGTFRWALWSGWAVNTLGAGLLILLDVQTATYARVLIFLVVGLGQGLLLSSLNFTIQAIVPVEDVSYGTALYAFFRGFGMCLGVAIGGTAFQNQLSNQLTSAGLPASIAENAEGYISTLNQLPSSSDWKAQVLDAYTSAFHILFIVLTAACAASGALSVVISHHTLDKPLTSDHVLEQKS